MGLGIGLISLENGSLGGGSLLGRMLHLKFNLPLGRSVFVIDSVVFPFSLFVIGVVETAFSLILAATSSFGIYLVHQAAALLQQQWSDNSVPAKQI